jgi:hypothetical protein
MDDRIDRLARRLHYEVTDEEAGQGRYVWKGDPDRDDPDPEVVGFLINHWRTASTTLVHLEAQLRTVSAELANARVAPPPPGSVPAPIDVVEVVTPDHPAHPEHPGRGRGRG